MVDNYICVKNRSPKLLVNNLLFGICIPIFLPCNADQLKTCFAHHNLDNNYTVWYISCSPSALRLVKE